MLSENPYLHLFRALVLNQPLKDLVLFIAQQQSEVSFREFLLWNRLTPLLYHRIRQQKSESYFSENFIIWLKSSHHKQVTRSLQQEAAIKEILRLLSPEGIQPILLKGIALAYSVYENPALRPMLDIDLLFGDDNDKRVRSVLLKHGGIETYAEESRHTTGLWHHIPPINFKGVVVELHNHLMASYEEGYLPLEKVISTPDSLKIGEFSCHTLYPEMQLYHLITHIHKHVAADYSRLIWLADLHLYIAEYAYRINWAKLMELATSAHLEVPFLKYLGLTRYILDSPIPMGEPVKKEIAREFLAICRKIVPGEEHIGTVGMMKKLRTTRQRLLFLQGKLFPSAAYLIKKFPGRKQYMLYYYVLLYWGYIKKVIGKKR